LCFSFPRQQNSFGKNQARLEIRDWRIVISCFFRQQNSFGQNQVKQCWPCVQERALANFAEEVAGANLPDGRQAK
jgi:hypothetical protein